MPRIIINSPALFTYNTLIAIRITDINYGGHVGNDSILSIIHEARVQFLKHHGYTEMELDGISLIMRDVAIDFKKELFYGENVTVFAAACQFSKVGFDICYKLEKETEKQTTVVALAKTGMICYDYTKKKIASLPESVRQKLSFKKQD